MDFMVEVKNLSFSYKEITVLKNVNFKIHRGDFFGIVGPNGSAKSTLIKLLLGLLKIQDGQIFLMGRSIEKFNQWDKVGYIPQRVRNFNRSFPATVEEIIGANLYHKMGLLKFLSSEDRKKISQVLRIVDMEGSQKKLIGSLSGGQQQKVFIARTLVNKPEIIFMDEPLVGIDQLSREMFYKLMLDLKEEGNITIVMVSHDLDGIIQHTSRIACLGKQGVKVYNKNSFNKTIYVDKIRDFR